jgi:hypothetical protein
MWGRAGRLSGRRGSRLCRLLCRGALLESCEGEARLRVVVRRVKVEVELDWEFDSRMDRSELGRLFCIHCL